MAPEHRRLRLLAWSNLNLEGGEPELRALERIVPPGCRTAIDAGANLGFYTLRLSGLAQNVHAFEINPGVTRDLVAAQLSNVRLVSYGLSDGERPVTLYVPLLGGRMPLYGWASLSRGNCPDTDVEMEIQGHVRPLDAFGLDDVDFIKIDVEGHELQVLQGARQTLEKCRPRILVEVRDLAAVSGYLGQLGYRGVGARDFGIRGAAPWMHVFDAR